MIGLSFSTKNRPKSSSTEVAARLGIHRKTLNKYLRLGKLPDFPPARLVGSSVRRWLSTEVEEWMERQPVADAPGRTTGSRPDRKRQRRDADPRAERYGATS